MTSSSLRDFQFDHPFLHTRHSSPFPSSRSAPSSPQAYYPSLPRLPAPSVPPLCAPPRSEHSHPHYPVRDWHRPKTLDEVRYFNQVAKPVFLEFRAEYERAFQDDNPRPRLDQLFEALFVYVRSEFKAYEIHKNRLHHNWLQQQSIRRDLNRGVSSEAAFKYLVGYWNFLYNRVKQACDIIRSNQGSVETLYRVITQLDGEVKRLNKTCKAQQVRISDLQTGIKTITSSLNEEYTRAEVESSRTADLLQRLDVCKLERDRSLSTIRNSFSEEKIRADAESIRAADLLQRLDACRLEGAGYIARIADLEERLEGSTAANSLHPTSTRALTSLEAQQRDKIAELERQVARSRSINRRLLDDVEIAEYSDLQSQVAQQSSTLAELLRQKESDAALIAQLRSRLQSTGASNVPDESQEAQLATARTEARVVRHQLSESQARERVLSRLAVDDDYSEEIFEEGQDVTTLGLELDSDSSVSHVPNLRHSSLPSTSPPVFVVSSPLPPPFATSPSSSTCLSSPGRRSPVHLRFRGEPDQLTTYNLHWVPETTPEPPGAPPGSGSVKTWHRSSS
ncbi:hypothetical protein CF319_g4217 [Tilletia indica]|nr:hypothetical protein CF319_g4217 [Tilletia indica]